MISEVIMCLRKTVFGIGKKRIEEKRRAFKDPKKEKRKPNSSKDSKTNTVDIIHIRVPENVEAKGVKE